MSSDSGFIEGTGQIIPDRLTRMREQIEACPGRLLHLVALGATPMWPGHINGHYGAALEYVMADTWILNDSIAEEIGDEAADGSAAAQPAIQ